MFVDQVAIKGDALRYYFSLSYNNNVLNQNSLMIIMYSFRQYCFFSELQPKSATHPSRNRKKFIRLHDLLRGLKCCMKNED